MPYKKHPAFIDLISDDATLWRYMGYLKLESLLRRSQLFFARADILGDNFEGAHPELMFKHLEHVYTQVNHTPTAFEDRRSINRSVRALTIVNCWHNNETESEGMWKLYAEGKKGVAVVTNCQRLKESLHNNPDEIYAGSIRYIDYEKGIFYDEKEYPERYDNVFSPFVHKRKQFKDEREYRVVVSLMNEMDKWQYDWSKEESEKGKFLNVDISHLIEKIVIAPGTEKSEKQLIRSIVNQFAPQIIVEDSAMDRNPLF